MKIVIAGGSGQIGTFLARHFGAQGDSVVVLSRTGCSSKPDLVSNSNSTASTRSAVDTHRCTIAQWNGETLGQWMQELDGADVLVNLAGRSVNCRYNEENRRSIIESRIKSTTVLAEAVRQCKIAPKVWLQSSTATIYAHRYDTANDEVTGLAGIVAPDAPDTWKFSTDVALRWEQAFELADLSHTRKVLMRSALVLSPDAGGVFDTLLRLVRFGLGGTAGDGEQFVSWVHDVDFIAAIVWIIQHESLSGAINIASPFPLKNSEFMMTLRRSWGTPMGLPAAKWMLELGAVFLNTETELVLKSRKVVPAKLLSSGFQFKFPQWKDAAEDLCLRWKKLAGAASECN